MKQAEIKSICVITLSNIGDIILTFPVIDVLRNEFPEAEISLVVGPKGVPLLERHPGFKNIFLFDKRQSLGSLFTWIGGMRKHHFDLMVDLRNTAIPFFLRCRYRTGLFVKKIPGEHMRAKHLRHLRSVVNDRTESAPLFSFHSSLEDEAYIGQCLGQAGGRGKDFIVVGPGAADQGKRWPPECFARLSDLLKEHYPCEIILIGDQGDMVPGERVLSLMKHSAINLCGKTTLPQLGCVFRKCRLAIVNDSAPLHLASYLDVPVIGLFGPTDPQKYGPWSKRSYALRKADGSESSGEECMKKITVEDVVEVVRQEMQFFIPASP